MRRNHFVDDYIKEGYTAKNFLTALAKNGETYTEHHSYYFDCPFALINLGFKRMDLGGTTTWIPHVSIVKEETYARWANSQKKYRKPIITPLISALITSMA